MTKTSKFGILTSILWSKDLQACNYLNFKSVSRPKRIAYFTFPILEGGNFAELHRVIMNLKSWLKGMHNQVRDLQDYLDEYSYRFNRSFMKDRF